MNNKKLMKTAIEIIRDVVGIEAEGLNVISPDTKLSELGLTSIQFVQMIVRFEQEFNIEILDSDLNYINFETIDKTISMVSKYVNTQVSLKKVLICDCDNVLWDGVAGENEISIDSNAQKLQTLLLELCKFGVILCLCSKNEMQNIEKAFNDSNMLLKLSDVLVIKANLAPKHLNIIDIANELNISPDQFVFIDDDDYELNLVDTVFPNIDIVKVDYSNLSFIDRIKSFFSDYSSPNDRNRLYIEQKAREKSKLLCCSIEEYNNSIQTRVLCQKATYMDSQRISELSLRTNQFNLSSSRYSEEHIKELIDDKYYSIFVVSAKDMFGDMGIVGAAIFNIKKATIESFFLSCRVFGRGFEYVLLNTIKENFGITLYGIYRKNKYNQRFESFFLENGINVI